MTNLAFGLSKQGKYTEAETLHRRTWEIRRRVLDDEHPVTLRSMDHLGLALGSQGKYAEAETLHRQTLEIRRRTLGDQDPLTALSRSHLGDCLTRMGRYDEAERELLEALRLLTAAYLADHHPAVVPTVDLLAALYEAWGKPEEAIRWLEELESIRRRRPARAAPSLLKLSAPSEGDAAQAVPSFDDTDAWASVREATDIENIDSDSLARYRRDGMTFPDALSGIDSFKRQWRRATRTAQHRYVRSTLINRTAGQ